MPDGADGTDIVTADPTGVEEALACVKDDDDDVDAIRVVVPSPSCSVSGERRVDDKDERLPLVDIVQMMVRVRNGCMQARGSPMLYSIFFDSDLSLWNDVV